VERVKNSPASICITQVGRDLEGDNLDSSLRICQEKLDICDLRQFPVISKLQIRTTWDVEPAHALSLMRHFPIGKLDCLEFEGLGNKLFQRPIHPPAFWSFTTFLGKFPPCTNLAVHAIPITTHEVSQFHSITRLLIGGELAVSLADLLPSFPNLEYLEVVQLCGLDEHEMTSKYEMTQLRYLSVEENWSFPWDAPIKTPNLTSLCLILKDTHISDDCESFLASCSALTSVELTMGDHSFTCLANVIGWLLHLTLDVDEDMLGTFVDWEEFVEVLPFPKLKTLTLVYPNVDRHVPAFWYFDDIVKKRCLPISNPASQLITPLLPLETLTIRQDPALQATWKESVHYATATARIVPEVPKYSSMTLSWILSTEEVVALQEVSKALFSQNSAPVNLIYLGFRHKTMDQAAKQGPLSSVSSYPDDLGTSEGPYVGKCS
jgi:hypothetical protein